MIGTTPLFQSVALDDCFPIISHICMLFVTFSSALNILNAPTVEPSAWNQKVKHIALDESGLKVSLIKRAFWSKFKLNKITIHLFYSWIKLLGNLGDEVSINTYVPFLLFKVLKKNLIFQKLFSKLKFQIVLLINARSLNKNEYYFILIIPWISNWYLPVPIEGVSPCCSNQSKSAFKSFIQLQSSSALFSKSQSPGFLRHLPFLIETSSMP